MKFSNLVDNLTSLKLKGFGKNFYGKVSNEAPLASLIGCVTDYATNMRQNLALYDSVACGLTSLEGVFDWYAKVEVDKSLGSIDPSVDTVIDISQDEGDAVICGFSRAQDVVDSGNFVTVTSKSGLAYALTVINGTLYSSNVNNKLVPVLWPSGAGYKVRVNWPSSSSEFEDENTISINNTISRSVSIIGSVTSNLPTDGTIMDRLIRIVKSIDDGAEPITYGDAIEVINDKYETGESTIGGTLIEVQDEVLPEPEPVVDDSDSVVVITEGLVESTTMNEVICDSVDALQTNTISGYLETAQVKYDSKKTVRTFVQKLVNSYKVGGLRGFLLFIIRLIKAQGSIADKDGKMMFTDNAALIPKEFIVGIVGTIIGAVLTVVGTILTIVAPIIGIIVSGIGSLLWSVLGSVKSTYNDTFSRMEEFLTETEELFALPYSPIALFRGSSAVSDSLFKWYLDYYKTHQHCTYVQVPGGVLFVGPGKFADNGELTEARFEFHPFTLPINSYGWIKFQAMFRDDEYTGKHRIHARIIDSRYIYSAWSNILSDSSCYSTPSNTPDGHLSEANDKKTSSSVIACCGVFLYWLSMVDHYSDGIDGTVYDLIPAGYSNSAEEILDSSHNFSSASGSGWCIQALGALASLLTSPEDLESWAGSHLWNGSSSVNTLNWANLLKCADAISTGSGNKFIGSVVFYESGHYYVFDSYFERSDLRTIKKYCRQLTDPEDYSIGSTILWNIGVPRPLPERPRYSIIPPTINRSTYWLWAALGIAITTAVTVGAVVGSIKYNKWRRTRQLTNAENANSARSQYANAIAGVKEVYNPETHQYDYYEFDVNSEEGQAYINSALKNYKQVCLKNNLMANVVGGTRYDYSSFWGNKEETADSVESPADNLKKALFGEEEDIIDVESIDNPQPNLSDVIRLINPSALLP